MKRIVVAVSLFTMFLASCGQDNTSSVAKNAPEAPKYLIVVQDTDGNVMSRVTDTMPANMEDKEVFFKEQKALIESEGSINILNSDESELANSQESYFGWWGWGARRAAYYYGARSYYYSPAVSYAGLYGVAGCGVALYSSPAYYGGVGCGYGYAGYGYGVSCY